MSFCSIPSSDSCSDKLQRANNPILVVFRRFWPVSAVLTLDAGVIPTRSSTRLTLHFHKRRA